MSLAWIGLGSNLGPREIHLRNAARSLSRLGRACFASVYETTPVLPPGVPPQGGLFLNTVCRLQTEGNVLDIFTALGNIERENQRVRPSRFAPRTLDLDLLAFDALCLTLGKARSFRPAQSVALPFTLGLPHRRMHLRKFVLVPLAEIDPLWRHPLLRQSAGELLRAVPLQGTIKWHCAASDIFL